MVPVEFEHFLSRPNPAVIATLTVDGRPSTVATWYLWEDQRVLVNMDEGRARLRHLRRNPRTSLTVIDRHDWTTHVSLRGRVVSLQDDLDLVDIDRLAHHYLGKPFRERGRRRVSAWIEIESWFAWGTSLPQPKTTLGDT